MLARRRDDPEQADTALHDATRALESIEAPFTLAQILTEHAEILHTLNRPTDAAPLTAQAITILQQLRATPWLQRAQALDPDRAPPTQAAWARAPEPAASSSD